MHAMPDLTTVMPITTHRFVHLVMQTLLTDFCQTVIKTERQATCFRTGEVMTPDAGIQPFHTVEDQAVNRVAGGKSQSTENVVISSANASP
jgi:hypothetical protein